MDFDALIFDLDGTLWDCSEASAAAFNSAYKNFGVERRVDREFIRSISGKPATEFVGLLLDGVPPELHRALHTFLDEREELELESYAPRALFPGVAEGVETLASRYPLYLVSNCEEFYLNIFCKNSSIGRWFKDCECFGRTQRGKAENIRDIMKRNNVTSACYIGDTTGDESAARTAELPFFHAAYGFGRVGESAASFESFQSLCSYFMSMPQAAGR